MSISDLDFSKCKPGDAHQSFSIESMDSVGTIKDEATGRCLAVKECTGTDGPTDLNKCSSTCELTGTHKVVVLDACSSSSDGCGGKSQQWTTKKDATGVLQFNSALNKAGAADDFTYISTAGGAFLEWMEGKLLPGVAALEQAA